MNVLSRFATLSKHLLCLSLVHLEAATADCACIQFLLSSNFSISLESVSRYQQTAAVNAQKDFSTSESAFSLIHNVNKIVVELQAVDPLERIMCLRCRM